MRVPDAELEAWGIGCGVNRVDGAHPIPRDDVFRTGRPRTGATPSHSGRYHESSPDLLGQRKEQS